MAKLFGCPLNVEAEEDDGSSIAVEVSRSSNSDSGSVSMESESDLHHCFIDFFDRESNQRLNTSRDFNLLGSQDMDEEIELGLRIGSGSGSDDSGEFELQVNCCLETDTGRVEIDTDRVEVDMGRAETDMDRVETDTGRVEIDTHHVEIETGRVEVETGRVEIEMGRVEVDLFVEEEEEAMMDDEEEDNLLFEEEIDGASWLVEGIDYNNNQEDEHMDQEEWNVGLFDTVTTDLFDSAWFLSGVDEYDDSYEDVLARTFDESGVNGSPPASKKVVDELPDVEITSEELSIGCAICKDEIVVEEEKVKRLPCSHYYHGECIVPWLGIRNTCPVCRYELPTDDLEYERKRKSQRGLARDLMSE